MAPAMTEGAQSAAARGAHRKAAQTRWSAMSANGGIVLQKSF